MTNNKTILNWLEEMNSPSDRVTVASPLLTLSQWPPPADPLTVTSPSDHHVTVVSPLLTL